MGNGDRGLNGLVLGPCSIHAYRRYTFSDSHWFITFFSRFVIGGRECWRGQDQVAHSIE